MNATLLYQNEIKELEFQNKTHFQSIAKINAELQQLGIEHDEDCEIEKQRLRKFIMSNARQINFCKVMIASLEKSQLTQEIPGVNA